MVKRGSITGWTTAEDTEFRMWFSLASIVCLTMVILWSVGFLDLFRLFLFSCPMWLTLIVAPCQQDKAFCKLALYSAGVFLLCWFAVQTYPVQCRHAWGSMMVADPTYFNNETAKWLAVLAEKDSFYRVTTVNEHDRGVFWPRFRHRGESNVSRTAQGANKTNLTTAMDILKEMNNATDEKKRIANWISSWSMGNSVNVLLLRSYCNIHQADEQVPYVFTLHALGILPNQVPAAFMAPCPLWSCLLTEARPNGKLVYLCIIGAAAVVNYIHYRCTCCSCEPLARLIGGGVARRWWWWFWAALLPLCGVFMIKTTYDMELPLLIHAFFHSMLDPSFKYVSEDEDNTHKIAIGVFIIGLGVAWHFRAAIRQFLGLDDIFWLQQIINRHDIHDDVRTTFQVCIWRVDRSAEDTSDGNAHPATRGPECGQEDGKHEHEANPGVGSVRSLMGAWAPRASSPSAGMSRFRFSGSSMLYLPMFSRQEATSVLSTPDGRVPSVSCHLFYGMEELQGSRPVKPAQVQWWQHEPVYFQEIFKLSAEWRPGAEVRFELRDASAAFGSTPLGTVHFSEAEMEEQFRIGRDASQLRLKEPVPITQYVRMSAVPPRSLKEEEAQIKSLTQVGFKKHRLSNGGAVWLAFYELEDLPAADTLSFCCCC